MKRLNVKVTSIAELTEKWGFNPGLFLKGDLYIRCNSKGDVNWKNAPVYRSTELIERNNVKILGKRPNETTKN